MAEKKAKKASAEKMNRSCQNMVEAKAKLKALEDALGLVNQLEEDNIQAGDLRSILKQMGVTLNDKEFREVLLKTGVAKDGTVNFHAFMDSLGKMFHFSELTVLKGTIQAIDRIEGDKVLARELPAFVRKMGIQLSDQEFQQTLKKVSVDGSGKVVVKEFIKVLTKVPHFSDLLVLKDTIKAVSCIQGEKIALQDFKPTLTKMGIHLTPMEYEEIINGTPPDREGKLDIGQVMNKISKTPRFSDMEVLNNALKAFYQFKDNKVKLSDVKACLSNIGVHFTDSELAEATKSLKFSPEGTIDVKELMSAVKGAKRFANCEAVHETIRALKLVKECKEMKLKQRKATLNSLGIRMANEVLAHVLRSARVTGTGQAKFNDFMRTLTRNEKFKTSSDLMDAFAILKKVKSGRIGVEDLKVVMKNFNIDLPPEEISQALSYCIIDDNKMVNLKEFLKGVTHTSTFLVSPELQLTCLVLSKLKDDHFDLADLKSTLDTMHLPEAKELLQEVMKTAKVNQQGKVNFKEFIRILLLLPEVPQQPVLKETLSAMSNIKDRVQVDELEKTLANLGIHLTPQEVKELKSSVPVSGDGTVNFQDVVMKLTGTKSFTEFNAVQGTFGAINKICKEKITKEDLPAALADLGICLSPEELQAVLTSAAVDESGMLNGTELLKMLVDAPRFTEFVALQDAIKVVENFKYKNMTLAQLKETLENMGVHLTQPAFQALVSKAKVDEKGEINFKDFLLALGETPEFTELEALQRATIMVGASHKSRLNLNDLESTLEDVGIHLTQQEFQEALRNVPLAADGTVNVKEFLTSLAKMRRFSESKALQSATEAFSRIKGEKVKVSELETIMESLEISLSNEELEEALKHVTVDGNGEVNFKEFLNKVMENERFSEPAAIHQAYGILNKVQDDKIEISELKDALGAIDITLNNEEMKEALDSVTVDDDGKVDMKKFMSGLSNTRRFSKLAEIEGGMETMKRIKQDKVDVKELDATLGKMDIHLSPSELQEALDYVTKNDDGTVSLKNFMLGLTKTRRFSKAERDRVPVENLDSILESMGLSLTKEEMEQALKRITVDEDGKVNLNAFMKSVKCTKQLSSAAGDQESVVAVEDVNSLLSKMGIHLTKEELEEALKHMSVDENGKVDLNKLMNYVLQTRTESQSEKDRVPVGNLDALLINMGIYLTDDEIQEALRYAVIDEDGKINLAEFMKGVKIVQRAANAEGKVVAADELSSTLAKMGVHLSNEEMETALKHITHDAEGKVSLKSALESVMATRQPSMFQKDRIAVQDLEGILASTGIYLTAKEMQEALKYAPVDANGKVNLGEFMKGVKAVQPHPKTGDRVPVGNLSALLSNMGIHLTDDEIQEALRYAVVDEDGKINLDDFMKGVKIVQQAADAKGKVVAADELSSTLAKMGIHLSKEEKEKALKHITRDAEGKVNLKSALQSVMATRQPSMFEKDRVAVQDLEGILASMGIDLTAEELQEALKYAPVDANGKVNLGEFMKGVRAVQPHPKTGDRVPVGNLGALLSNMGIYLTDDEIQEALRYAVIDEDGKINLAEFMKGVKIVQRAADAEGEMVAADDLSSTLAKMGIHLSKEEKEKALKHIARDAEGKVSLKSALESVMATRQPAMFQKDRVAVQDLEGILASMGIYLTAEELQEALKYAPVDVNGKVNLGEFMKGVKAVQQHPKTGDRVPVGNLDSLLVNMGIYLTDDEIQEALRYAVVDEDGKINLDDFMKGVKIVQRAKDAEGEMVAADDLSSTLAKMGIHLSKEEKEKALKHIARDAEGKVSLKSALENVMATRQPAMFQKDRVAVQDLEGILASMGIYLTAEELQEALKYAPVDANGKVNLGEFMKGVKAVQQHPKTGVMVAADDLSSTLAKMGIHLSKEEKKKALKHITRDAEGKVSLKSALESVMATRQPAMFQKDRVAVQDLEGILASMGIDLTAEELQEALKYAPVDANGKVNLGEFMKGVKAVQQHPKTEDRVAVQDLEGILASMGIDLTAEELQEALKYAPVDANGKVNLGEFMKGVKAVQQHPKTGEMVAADDLSSTLAKMGIHLSKEEKEKALKHITRDAEGKVSLKSALESVMATRQPAMFQKDRVAVQDLEGILASMGIDLTAEELQEALKYAPVDANGKVNLGEFMKGVKAVQQHPKTGEMVAADDLSSTLAKMGIHLSKEEEKALKHIARDAEGKVSLKSALEIVMATRQPAMFQKDRVAVQDLEGILASMGIDLTAEELQEALKYAPVDANGKVNLGEFMKGVKAVQQHPKTGVMVAADDLSSTLAKMGIHLSKEEKEKALKHITRDAEGKVSLKSALENVMATRQPAMFQKDRVAVQDLEGILASMGIDLTAEELQEALKYAPVDANGKVNLGEFMKGVKEVQQHPKTGEMVAADDLSSTLAKMGIHLSEEEKEKALKHIASDAEGKVSLKSALENVMATRQPAMFQKDRVAVQDLEGILASMGIDLTAKELQEALKYAPVDANGKVNLGEFMKGVKAVQPHPKTVDGKANLGEFTKGVRAVQPHPKTVDGKVNFGEFTKGAVQPHPKTAEGTMDDLKGVKRDLKGVKQEIPKMPSIKPDRGIKGESRVDVDSLDTVLLEMGVHLTPKQLHEAMKYAPVNADGKVDLEAFKKGVRDIMKTEKRVDASKLKSALADIGIHLTPQEVQRALRLATVNKDGTVNLKDVLWAAQAIPSIKNKKVKISNLNSVLAALGIYLTHEELQEALTRTRLNEDGTVNLSDFIRACNATLTLPSTQARHLSQKPDAKILKLPKVMDKDQNIGRTFSSVHSPEKIKFGEAKILTNAQLEAFRKAYDTFSKDPDGKIDLPGLQATADNLGISLTEEEAFEELVYADADGDGKVNFTDFLSSITDSKRFVQAVAPKKGRMETVDARGILFFELLSKLVETSTLPRKTIMTIVSYFRQKFLESNRKAWRTVEKKHHLDKKGRKQNESSSLAAFAGAGRIVVMKDKELESFVKNLQETTPPSDSPYAKVPIFPLIPNQDCVMAGKPKKDTHKLETQRRMEPVSSFEDHFFRKKMWLPVSKSSKTDRPTLTLPPELASKGRSLTMNNINEIRREVKKVTDSYRKAIAAQERNKSLKLWRRLRGGEIGLESGNPSFYQTFSTYTWSWNICQEMLTPRELHEYDNQLYHSLSRLDSPANRLIKADEKQRESRK